MFSIRLVTIIVYTILVVCSIIQPHGRGVIFLSKFHLAINVGNGLYPLSQMLVGSSYVRSFVSLQMLLAMVKKVFILLLCPECWCFFPTFESFSVVPRALHISSHPYLIRCANKDLHLIIVEKELHMSNLLYSSSYSQTIDLY